MCEEYSIAREQALEMSKQYFYEQERRHVAGFLPGDTHRQLEVETRFSQVNSDLCLLPVYVLSYRYKDKLYRFLVNGQTGKIAGDKPLSWRKIGSAIGIAVAIIVVIFIVVLLLGGGR
jgi:hypothetical protein